MKKALFFVFAFLGGACASQKPQWEYFLDKSGKRLEGVGVINYPNEDCIYIQYLTGHSERREYVSVNCHVNSYQEFSIIAYVAPGSDPEISHVMFTDSRKGPVFTVLYMNELKNYPDVLKKAQKVLILGRKIFRKADTQFAVRSGQR